MAEYRERMWRWRCRVCDERLTLANAWFDDDGPLCSCHAMVKRMGARRGRLTWNLLRK